MATRANDDGTTDDDLPYDSSGLDTIESYETDEGVVFYDAENPLAWVETSRPLSLDEVA